MSKLTIEVDEETARKLGVVAERIGLTVEALVHRSLDKVARVADIPLVPGLTMGPDGRQLTFSRMEMYGELD